MTALEFSRSRAVEILFVALGVAIAASGVYFFPDAGTPIANGVSVSVISASTFAPRSSSQTLPPIPNRYRYLHVALFLRNFGFSSVEFTPVDAKIMENGIVLRPLYVGAFGPPNIKLLPFSVANADLIYAIDSAVRNATLSVRVGRTTALIPLRILSQ